MSEPGDDAFLFLLALGRATVRRPRLPPPQNWTAKFRCGPGDIDPSRRPTLAERFRAMRTSLKAAFAAEDWSAFCGLLRDCERRAFEEAFAVGLTYEGHVWWEELMDSGPWNAAVRRDRPWPEADNAEATITRSESSSPDPELSWESKAIALIVQERDITVRELARRVGKTTSAVYRSKTVRPVLDARATPARVGKGRRPDDVEIVNDDE